jgi:ubiquinone/menaquinone biosynthesis C-methylase UbiE
MSLLGLVERAYYLFHRRGDIVARLLDHMAPRDPPPAVLDFGGGTGWISRALAKARPGTYTIADIDRAALRRASGRPCLQPVVIAEQGPLPFAPESFDVILVVDVMHHLPDAPIRLAELARVLRPGGELLIVEFDRRRWIAPLLTALSRYRPHPCRLWSPDELRLLCARIGFAAASEPVDPLRYLVRAVGRSRTRGFARSGPALSGRLTTSP